MDENTTTDGRTAMERLCRELMDDVNESPYASLRWCLTHVIDVETNASDIYGAARADIERRIAEADLEDDRARDVALGDWKEKVAELDALKSAGRVMPEGLSWPRYEDGEPVRIGGEVDLSGKPLVVERVELSTSGCVLRGTIDGACGHTKVASHGVPFKRPAPKAVGADGVEVKPGETVWLAEEYRDKALSTGPSHNLHYVAAMEEMTVSKVKNGRYFEVAWMYGEGSRWCPTSWLTHERPDSWERLREDATKNFVDYWGCAGKTCDKCPALVDGKKPNERYDTAGCQAAEQLDLLARAERLAGVSADA